MRNIGKEMYSVNLNSWNHLIDQTKLTTFAGFFFVANLRETSKPWGNAGLSVKLAVGQTKQCRLSMFTFALFFF